MEFKVGTYIKCIANLGIESHLTIGKKYQVSEFKFDRSIMDYTVTIIDDNGLYQNIKYNAFIDENQITNVINFSSLSVIPGEQVILNLKQLIRSMETYIGIDGVIYYLEYFLNLFKEKRAAQFKMFEPIDKS